MQNSTPVSLLKELRETAAIMCYNHCFSLLMISSSEFQHKIFNMYYGDEDINITSQVKLIYTSKLTWKNLHRWIQTVVTNAEEDILSEINGSQSIILVLHSDLLAHNSYIQCISETHFNTVMFMCLTKNLTKERFSRWFLLNLCK